MLASSNLVGEKSEPDDTELKVVLPEHLKLFFREQGYSPTTAEHRNALTA